MGPPNDTIILLLCVPMIKLVKATDSIFAWFLRQNLEIAEQFTSHALKTNCLNESSIIA